MRWAFQNQKRQSHKYAKYASVDSTEQQAVQALKCSILALRTQGERLRLPRQLQEIRMHTRLARARLAPSNPWNMHRNGTVRSTGTPRRRTPGP